MTKKILSVGLIYTLLSLLASGFNFLYYPVISKLLLVSQFGDVQIGVSFIMLAATLFSSLSILALYSTAMSRASGESSANYLEKIIITISLVIVVGLVTFAHPLSDLLNMQDPALLYILSLIFLINIPAATWIGSLLGNGQFIASGIIGVTAAIFKIAFSALFIYLGYGAHGALLGMCIGFAIVLPLVQLMQNKPLNSYKRTFSLARKSDFISLKQRPALVFILISLILVSIIASLDVTFAKIYLTPEQSGHYAQLSTAAKIVFFAIQPITIIFFEQLINGSRRIRSALSTVALLIITGSVVIYLAKDFILNSLFGASDSMSTFYMQLISFGLLSLLIFVVYALISKRAIRALITVAVVSCSSVLILLINSQHSFYQIAYSFMLSLVIATSLSAICLASWYLHNRKAT